MIHLPRRRFWRLTIYLVCLVLVLLAADVVWARARRTIHPGYDTTRITSPLLDNGRIDYLAAIETNFSRGVTSENNAAPLLFEAFGREALPKTQPPDGITSRLGMAHLPEKGNYYACWQDFAKAPGEPPAPMTWDLTKPETWPAADSPKTLAWLKANEKPLQLIEQATGRARLFIPFDGGNRPVLLISVLLPHVRPLRDSSLALLVRARVRLNSGQLDGCREDLLAAHRLARLISQQATLVERAFAYQLE
ncbi:MAG TPA: hypothetical protein VN541_03640, partial [Tepidisphaeraceae bacterium]|nr:hypothetical protein [Tepidisphaeraceae bacterium]